MLHLSCSSAIITCSLKEYKNSKPQMGEQDRVRHKPELFCNSTSPDNYRSSGKGIHCLFLVRWCRRWGCPDVFSNSQGCKARRRASSYERREVTTKTFKSN